MSWRLYGTPGSLYTAKVRSYLVKQGIGFSDHAAGEARFRAEIAPRVGRWIIPVLEGADGQLLQDGTDIIAHFEAGGSTRLRAYPLTPRHRVIGHVFELFGGEGLLRPAMHYRWNFDETNLPFLANDFAAALAPTGAPESARAEIFAGAARRMRRAMDSFGVSEASIPLIEAAYEQFLDLFDAHLAGSPYLLGGAPTIGDYGLVAPLFAHLSRDPVPSALMKRRAHRVWRWVERMNRADADAGEYGSPPPDLFADDAVPDTLKALLRFVAEDYLPELRAQVGFANAWLEERPDLEPGTLGLKGAGDRVMGRVTFPWRGVTIDVGVMPYRFYLLQKVQDAADGAGPEVQAMLAETGLTELLTLKTHRRIARRNHLEVWV